MLSSAWVAIFEEVVNIAEKGSQDASWTDIDESKPIKHLKNHQESNKVTRKWRLDEDARNSKSHSPCRHGLSTTRHHRWGPRCGLQGLFGDSFDWGDLDGFFWNWENQGGLLSQGVGVDDWDRVADFDEDGVLEIVGKI